MTRLAGFDTLLAETMTNAYFSLCSQGESFILHLAVLKIFLWLFAPLRLVR
ncbi:MAG: hypothetical protein H7838_09165 [Magnetococcus sp. DMHC-8]